MHEVLRTPGEVHQAPLPFILGPFKVDVEKGFGLGIVDLDRAVFPHDGQVLVIRACYQLDNLFPRWRIYSHRSQDRAPPLDEMKRLFESVAGIVRAENHVACTVHKDGAFSFLSFLNLVDSQ